MPAGWTGVQGKVADAFNDVLVMSERRASEAERVARVVGKEGRLRQSAEETSCGAKNNHQHRYIPTQHPARIIAKTGLEGT